MPKIEIGKVVFFEHDGDFYAGKVTGAPDHNGQTEVLTYTDRSLRLKRHVSELGADYDESLQAYREKYPGRDLDPEHIIELMQFLRGLD